jgi:hypothetical protein
MVGRARERGACTLHARVTPGTCGAPLQGVIGEPAPVSVRESSGGAYQSVRVGPVVVKSPDECLAVFHRMRADKRLKFHL